MTPCNYARAWHDSPTQFSEFATMARYARGADSAHLRSVGERLASAVTSHDTAAISAAAADLFTTCKQLGLVTNATGGIHDDRLRSDGSATTTRSNLALPE